MRWLELCDVLSFSLKKHGLTFQCPEPTASGSQIPVSLQPPGVGVPAERVCSEPSPGPWNLHLGAPSVAHGPLSRALLGEILHTPPCPLAPALTRRSPHGHPQHPHGHVHLVSMAQPPRAAWALGPTQMCRHTHALASTQTEHKVRRACKMNVQAPVQELSRIPRW